MDDVKQKSWFKRNWMWAVPVGGCGCGCIGIILLFVFGIGAAFFGFSKVFNTSEPVKYALEQAKNNPEVMAALGDNLTLTGVNNGNISLNNKDGEIDVSQQIIGSKGKGTLVVKGIKVNGKWVYEDLHILIRNTQEQINLLPKLINDI